MESFWISAHVCRRPGDTIGKSARNKGWQSANRKKGKRGEERRKKVFGSVEGYKSPVGVHDTRDPLFHWSWSWRWLVSKEARARAANKDSFGHVGCWKQFTTNREATQEAPGGRRGLCDLCHPRESTCCSERGMRRVRCFVSRPQEEPCEPQGYRGVFVHVQLRSEQGQVQGTFKGGLQRGRRHLLF